MKLILAFIAVLFCSGINAQHLIITNNNDSIEVKILDKDDSIYHIKRLQKPKQEGYITESFIKKIIAIGDDTLYNIYSNNPIESPIAIEKPKVEVKNQQNNQDLKTQAYWLNRSGEHMNSAITLNLIGTTLIACSNFLVQEKKSEYKFTGANNVQYAVPYYEKDFTFVYLTAGLGIAMNIISIVSWYQCSEALKKASYQQKITLNASPVGASVAFRF